MDKRRVWVSSFAAYNDGRLDGAWFDAESCPQNGQEFVTAMAERGHEMQGDASYHEEVWCFDFSGDWYGQHAEMSPCQAYELDASLTEFEDACSIYDPIDILAEHFDEAGLSVEDWAGRVSEISISQHDDWTDYAQEIVEDLGILGKGASDLCRQYFDYAAFGRDLQLETECYIERPGALYVIHH